MAAQLLTENHPNAHRQWVDGMACRFCLIEMVSIKKLNFHARSTWHSWSLPPPVFTSCSSFLTFLRVQPLVLFATATLLSVLTRVRACQ